MGRLILGGALALVVTLVVPSADASFPGQNGRIVFVSNRAPNLHRAQIYSVRSDGSGRKQRLSVSAQPESHATLSPDGRRIAFLRSGDLYVMPAEGARARRLAEGGAEAFAPVWSPSGGDIAFRPKGGGIALVASRGGATRLVTADGTSPSWAPDGKTLAFERDVPTPDGPRGEIHVVRIDGSGDTKIANGFRPARSPRGARIAFVDLDHHVVVVRDDGLKLADLGEADLASPAWSPDGRRLAFTSTSYAIFVASPSGADRPRRLTTGRYADFDPLWSPTGRQIAFVRRQPGAGRDSNFGQLWVIDAVGRRARRISNEPPGSRFPGFSWSLDERRVVFAAEQAEKDGDIYTMDSAGGSVRRLTANFRYELQPKWSPDGTKIVFSRFDGVYAIYVMRADGTGVMKITSPSGTNDLSPSWSPSGRQIAFVRQSAQPRGYLTGQVFVVNADGRGLRRISGEPGEYSGLSWSPDGTSFAYLRQGYLYLMRPDGLDARRLLSSYPSVMGFAWSPDGGRLAAGHDYPDPGIDGVNVDGTGQAVLVPGVRAGDLSWSPNGRKLALRTPELRIAVADIATGRVSVLDTGVARGADSSPDWQAQP